MAKPKVSGTHKVTIRKREGVTGIMTGANTELLLDGNLVKGATAVYFQMSAREPAKVTIELIADVEVEGDVEVETVTQAQKFVEETDTAPEAPAPVAELPKPLPYDPNHVADPRAAHRPDPNAWIK